MGRVARPHYRPAKVPDVRIALEKVSAELAASGANGGSLRLGENSGTLEAISINYYPSTICDEKTDIDASLSTDIIPRGCELRQSRQACLGVPNARGSKVREFGTSNDVALHGGFGRASATVAAAHTASSTIETEGMVSSHVSEHEDRVYDRGSGQNL